MAPIQGFVHGKDSGIQLEIRPELSWNVCRLGRSSAQDWRAGLIVEPANVEASSSTERTNLG